MTEYIVNCKQSFLEPRIKIFENNQEIADYLAHHLSAMIPHDNLFHLCLSGGNTPKSIFSLISDMKKPVIPWNNVVFYWGDERCVPPDHLESNYLMAKNSLIDKLNIREECIFRIMGESNPEIEKERYGKIIHRNTKGVFDLVLLGLGIDGHTASIFPNQMQILESKKACAIAVHPDTGQIRITITGNIINKSKQIIFLVTGREKSGIIYEIVNKTGDWIKYPASHVHPPEANVIWLLDKKAGSML